MRNAIALGLVFVLAACTQEPTCGFNGNTLFPEMEAAKAAFLAGDYAGFGRLVEVHMPGIDLQSVMAGVAKAVPDGFASCATILQRQDAGGLVQELTLFTLADGEGLVVVYLQSALIAGERRVLKFSYDTDLDKMMVLLR